MPTVSGKDVQSFGLDTVAQRIMDAEKDAATKAGVVYKKTKAEIVARLSTKPIGP